MNNLIGILRIMTIFAFFISCECEDCTGDGNYKVKAIINYVNETSENVFSIQGCDRDIAPGKTLTFIVEETLGSSPNINSFPVSIFTNCSMMYENGNELKCETGINSINNYEDKKELEPLVFEFTFKFTEEKKEKAISCKL